MGLTGSTIYSWSRIQEGSEPGEGIALDTILRSREAGETWHDPPDGPAEQLPPACAVCAVHESGFCGKLSGCRLEELTRHRTWLDLPADRELRVDGHANRWAGVLVHGYLRMAHYDLDGDRKLVGLKLPGDLLGPRSSEADDFVLETSTDVRICRFDLDVFNRLFATSDAFRHLTYGQARSEVDRLHFLTWTLGALDTKERLAAFLATAIRYMPWQPLSEGGGVLTMDLPRRDVADLLGTTVESISRITQSMDREGLIRIRDPYHFEIPDVGRLARLGGIEELTTVTGIWADDPTRSRSALRVITKP